MNLFNLYNDTALHLAANKGDIKLAKKLMGCGACLDAQNSRGETPLYYVVGRSHKADFALFLLENGADPNICGKFTVLSHAISVLCSRHDFSPRNLEVIQKLIEKGVDINAQCIKGKDTALHRIAVYCDHWSRYPDPSPGQSSEMNMKYLMTILKCLVKNGADPSIRNKDNEIASDLLDPNKCRPQFKHDIENIKGLLNKKVMDKTSRFSV